MPILMPPVDAGWQSQLADVQDALLVVSALDELVVVLGKLTTLIGQEFTVRDAVHRVAQGEIDTLKALVRDAYRLLNDDLECLSWRDDVKDWTRAAKPLVKG